MLSQLFSRKPTAEAAPLSAVSPTTQVDRPVSSPPEAPAARSDIADVTRVGATVIATLTDIELCGEDGAGRLGELLYALHESGAIHFVLDLQNVDLIDSCCLARLVASTNRLAQAGGHLALVNPAHNVQQLFRLSRLDRLFPIYGTVLNALQAIEQKQVRYPVGL